MKTIYIAGPYSGPNKEVIKLNIQAAKYYAYSIIKHKPGWFPVTPHLNTAEFDDLLPDTTQEFWLEGTMKLMESCDAIVVMTGYKHSKGTAGEIERAAELKMPIYYSIEEIPCHNSRT